MAIFFALSVYRTHGKYGDGYDGDGREERGFCCCSEIVAVAQRRGGPEGVFYFVLQAGH